MAERRIFIAWDSGIPGVQSVLEYLREDQPADGVEFLVLGLDADAAVGTLRKHVVDAIAGADGVLAIVDQPNGYVGWEIGLGLAHGLPLALVTAQKGQPPWVKSAPLRGRLHHHTGLDPGRLLDAVQAFDRWTPAPLRPDQAGTGPALLCPDNATGGILRLKARGVAQDIEAVDLSGADIDHLPQLVARTGHAAWVLPEPVPDQVRDGDQTARLGVLAGYLEGCGVPVELLRHQRARDLVHLPCDQPFASNAVFAEQLDAWLVRVRSRGQAGDTPLTTYLRAVHALHAHPLPYIQARLGRALDVVPVELVLDPDLDPECLDRHPVLAGHEGRSLRALLDDSGPGARFLVVAEPGAGKSTLLRHLSARLAEEQLTRGAPGPVPVFLSLALFEEQPDKGPLDVVAEQLGGGKAGAAAVYQALATQQLWLFLDGYDEVRRPAQVRARILAAAQALPQARLVVTTRPVANTDPDDWPGFHHARIRYLDEGKQHQLVDELLDRVQAERFWGEVADRPGFAVLRRNPFLLTLAAVLALRAWQDGTDPPPNRIRLLQAAVDDCLKRGWGMAAKEGKPRQVKDLVGARVVLRHLSLALQQRGGEAWPQALLSEELHSLRSRVAAVREQIGAREIWESTDHFLRDLHDNAGLIGPLDGIGGHWRYLHRSFKELLAAEAVVALDEGERQRVLSELWGKERERLQEEGSEELPRSGEVVAMVCELRGGEEALGLLRALRERAPDLVVRALASVEDLDAWTRLQLFPESDWDADGLDAVVDALGESGSLWRAVSTGRTVRELGLLWYALERLEGRSEQARRRFFAACRPGVAPPQVETVLVPAGSFWMGSSQPRERPRHRVSLSQGFRLGTTPVTQAQWAAFSGEQPRRPDHPVTGIDWLGARLFAAWLGGRLPTEAEWEYACRAGTDTAYSFGDDPAALEEHGWFRDNSGRSTHTVGELKPNPWGLYDMHGHVWEWSEDRFGSYEAGEAVDPEGPTRGGVRVVRGGSFVVTAGWCRSAYRYFWRPWVRSVSQGFRVLLPAAAPSLDH